MVELGERMDAAMCSKCFDDVYDNVYPCLNRQLDSVVSNRMYSQLDHRLDDILWSVLRVRLCNAAESGSHE